MLKLIMNNKNIYMPNNFYIEWVSYLIPVLDDNKYINSTINDIVPMFNIKYNIITLFEKLLCNKNMNINLYFYDKNIEQTRNKDIKCLTLDIINSIYNIFHYSFVKFNIEIPIKTFSYIKNINWTFHKFNNFIISIWEEYYGLIMDDYISSSYLKKIIYYIFFKKIFMRSIVLKLTI